MIVPTLKSQIEGDKKVYFCKFENNTLWYRTEIGLEFPIEGDDLKGATFLPEDRAILYMRWIRKRIDVLNKAQKE